MILTGQPIYPCQMLPVCPDHFGRTGYEAGAHANRIIDLF